MSSPRNSAEKGREGCVRTLHSGSGRSRFLENGIRAWVSPVSYGSQLTHLKQTEKKARHPVVRSLQWQTPAAGAFSGDRESSSCGGPVECYGPGLCPHGSPSDRANIEETQTFSVYGNERIHRRSSVQKLRTQSVRAESSKMDVCQRSGVPSPSGGSFALVGKRHGLPLRRLTIQRKPKTSS